MSGGPLGSPWKCPHGDVPPTVSEELGPASTQGSELATEFSSLS